MKILWNIKVKVVQIVIGPLAKGLQDLEAADQVETL